MFWKTLLLWSCFVIDAIEGQDIAPGQIELTFVHAPYSHLGKLVQSESSGACSIWVLNSFTLLDSLHNELAVQNVWAKGLRRIANSEIKFERIKAAPLYYLKYYENRKEVIDTIRLKKIRSQRIDLPLFEAESAQVKREPTIIEQMLKGDSLFIEYQDWGCKWIHAKLKINFDGTNYSAELKEYYREGRPSKYVLRHTFKKAKLYEKHIKVLKAFEYDSRRTFLGGCSDMGNSYLFRYKGKTARLEDNCGGWGGYYLLKTGLFWD